MNSEVYEISLIIAEDGLSFLDEFWEDALDPSIPIINIFNDADD